MNILQIIFMLIEMSIPIELIIAYFLYRRR